MGWKGWSYWLKGGFILGAINVVLSLISLMMSASAEDSISKAFAFFWIALIDYPAFKLAQSFLSSSFDSAFGAFLIAIIFGTIQWFLIGTILGWIVGKIKSK